MSKSFFITATDTGVGKTITTMVMGYLFQAQGYDVGVLKPVQCAGDDIERLSKQLGIKDERRYTNPYFAPEPLSPHLALRRSKQRFNSTRIKTALKKIKDNHDIVLIEGAGGLMVPLRIDYMVADLARDLNVPLVIVARLGLGTINHTLLTIAVARAFGLKIKGLVFSQSSSEDQGIPQETNPREIEKISGERVLGIIPYLNTFNKDDILKQCANLKLPK